MNDDEEKASEPIFSTNDLGNRFLWLGKLLHDYDEVRHGVKGLRLTPESESNKELFAAIYDFQHRLQHLIASKRAPAILFRLFMRKHGFRSILDGEKIRIIVSPL